MLCYGVSLESNLAAVQHWSRSEGVSAAPMAFRLQGRPGGASFPPASVGVSAPLHFVSPSPSVVTSRFADMKRLVVIALLVVVVLLCFWQGRPAYRRYKQNRLAAQMREFMQQGDQSSAMMSAGLLLRMNPSSEEACRVMAELYDRSQSPMAVAWWRRVAELSPTLTNRLQLAGCALRWEAPPFALVQRTLEAIPPAERSTAAFHVIASRLSLQLLQPARAAAHLQEAARLEPDNPRHEINLATLRLQSTNRAWIAGSLATLERLSTNQTLEVQALRSLVAWHLSQSNLAAARGFSGRLLDRPHAAFEDRITHLTVLHQAGGADFSVALERTQAQVATNAAQVGVVCDWMMARGVGAAALEWVQGLPADMRLQQPVPQSIAQCFAQRKEWRKLELFLQERSWGDQDAIRLAWMSLASQEQREEEPALIHWRKAVQAASDRPDSLLALARQAHFWNWAQRREEVLSLLAEKYPHQAWGLESLGREYQSQGNTPGLARIYGTLHRLNTTNAVVMNDLAMVTLLLQTNLDQAHRLARQAYESNPTSAVLASTYGFSLLVQGKTNDARAVLEKMPLAEREQPAIALYCGLSLAGTGETNGAARYFARAESARLLPEEKALLQRARRNLSGAP